MKTNSFSFIALRILLLPFKSTAQLRPTIECPSLPSNQQVSRIQCENHDGSVVEVDGSRPFNCKLSWVAIRPRTTKSNTDQQQKPLIEERGQCELWLLQFRDDGLVQQSCCGEAGERLVNRVSRAQEKQDPDWDLIQQSLEFQDGVETPVQHVQTDYQVGSDDDEAEEVEEEEYEDEDEVQYEDENENEDEDEDEDDDKEGESGPAL